MVTANKFSGVETENNASLVLLREETTKGELTLALALYRITLKAGSFYLVSVEDLKREGACSAAEVLGEDPTDAEAIFEKLVRGTVPPNALREIVYDLRETQVFEGAFAET